MLPDRPAKRSFYKLPCLQGRVVSVWAATSSIRKHRLPPSTLWSLGGTLELSVIRCSPPSICKSRRGQVRWMIACRSFLRPRGGGRLPRPTDFLPLSSRPGMMTGSNRQGSTTRNSAEHVRVEALATYPPGSPISSMAGFQLSWDY